MLLVKKIKSLRITQTNNEIKNIMKVIKSFEKRAILLRGTTNKIIRQEGGFLSFLISLISVSLPLKKNATQLVKGVLVPLRLTVVVSATHAAIEKNIFGSGTLLAFSNGETDDIIKIVKFVTDAGFLIKGVNGRNENEAKDQKGGHYIVCYFVRR